jgi:hypothetical protein
LIFSVALGFFAIPHLIDDFLFDVPEEFGIRDQSAQVLSGIFTVLLFVILILSAKGRKAGYVGALSTGIFLSLAVILKHLPEIIKPEPYWSGWFSEVLILGLLVSGMGLAFVSILALRAKDP